MPGLEPEAAARGQCSTSRAALGLRGENPLPAGRTRPASPAARGKTVRRCLLSPGKTASRSRKTNCSKLVNITNSSAGLPNTAAVFVFGILKGLGLLLAWEACLGQQSAQECSYSHFEHGYKLGVISATA